MADYGKAAYDLASTKVIKHVKEFGAVGDGQTLNDDAFEEMAQFFRDNPGAVVEFEPKGVYVFSRNIYFPSKVNIRGRNATIWSRCTSGGVDNSVDRNIGMWNFWGTVSETATTVVSVGGLIGDYFGTDSQNLPVDGKITVTDASSYNIGDYIYFDINSGGYTTARLTPKEKKVLRIINKSGNTLTVDYTSPWSYSGLTIYASIRKCYPCEDVSISDLKIHDELIVNSAKDPNVNTPGTENFVSCLSFNYAFNVKIRNVYGTNTKFPIVHVFNTSKITVDGGYVDKPAVVGSGEGYFAQFVHCKDVEISRIYGDLSRHLIDFTNCAFCVADTAIGYRTYATAFQLHGHYEHNITWRNTVGNMGLSSGTTFGEANTRITIENHNGWLQGGYLEDYKITRSKIRMRRMPNGVIEDSDIFLYLDSPYVQDPRIAKANLKTRFINCTVDVYGAGTSTTISNTALISFKGGKLLSTKNPSTGFTINLNGVEEIRLEDIEEMRGILLRPTGTGNTRITMDKVNLYTGTIDAYVIEPKNASGGAKIRTKLDRVIFTNERQDSQKGKLFRLPSNDATVTGVIQELIIRDCEVDNALITGEQVSGATNDVYFSSDNRISNSTVTVSNTIAHYKIDDLVW